MNPIQNIGAKTIAFIQALGATVLFLLNILMLLPQSLFRMRLTVRQMYFSGVMSVLIIAVSGLFVGMVIGLQGYTQLAKFKSADVLGFMVAASLLRELGPVLAAILFASSAGGAMTSEIGLMKTTEQLEAMNVLAVNPVARVVAPRFWAGVLSMQNNIDVVYDVGNGLLKSLIFGMAVSLIAVYQGFHCTPTAEGILRASTRTVVSSALTVLALDFILTAFMFT